MTSEQTWTPIRSLFRLAVSICRLGNTCWRHICEGLHSCFHALEPILDGYSSDSSNRQYQLETLVREFVKTKSMDIHEFISKWFILTTDKENLDCLSFDRSKGPLGFHSNEFANDPFEDTLLSLRQVWEEYRKLFGKLIWLGFIGIDISQDSVSFE